MEWLVKQSEMVWRETLALLASPDFYIQIAIVLVALPGALRDPR